MDYIKQAFYAKHDVWRYIVGLLIILVAWQFVGAIPLMIALVLAVVKQNGDLNNTPTDIAGLVDLLGQNSFLVLMLISFLIGLISLFLVVKFIHNQSFTSLTTARAKVDWKRVLFSFFFWGIISSAMVILDYQLTPEDYVWNFDLQKFLVLAVIGIVLLPFQTSFEEYLFRGYLMQGIGVIARNRWLPLVITSVIFGVMHIANPEVEKLGYVIMVYYIGTGFFLGIITLMDEGMELALGFHAANNLFTALLVTADWTALQTDSILKDISEPGEMALGEIFVPVFIVFPILLFIFSKMYKWNNWNDRLFGKVEAPELDITTDIGNDTNV
ncbi:lysostaphin resistance A-like protein [Mesoflavibacter sp.]|uniref:CPBP family intramembrane glutamic endopeptidase n=1 Tax=Mesoflavibacter sp. TaxID=1930902 RepID=UPI003515F760